MSENWLREAEGDWRRHFEANLVAPDEAVKRIERGDEVHISIGQQVECLVVAMIADMDRLSPVGLSTIYGSDMGWYEGQPAEAIRMNLVYGTPMSRPAINDFRADYTPWWVYGAHKALDEGRPGARPIDVALIGVSPPNRWGYCCFGTSLWDAKTTAKRARKVIGVVNSGVPETYGDTWIHVSEIDCFVADDQPRPEYAWAYPEPDPWDMPIAQHVGSLIKDRDTLQIGTGSTTGNIPRSGVLDDKHDLGFFSELTVPGTVELVKKEIITSKYMATHPGKFVTTTAGNDGNDIAYITRNPRFEFYSTDYMHHPGQIGRNENMVAIDNALSIDLTGQIAAGHIGTRVYSGTGGHLAYALGAFLSPGGRYICVLPATASGGTISRIVPTLAPGQIVTVPRDIADIVVTEYGIAHLLNKTQRQRSEELISIAHPDFRAELRREAAKLYGL